jgi:hypothetical protein
MVVSTEHPHENKYRLVTQNYNNDKPQFEGQKKKNKLKVRLLKIMLYIYKAQNESPTVE